LFNNQLSSLPPEISQLSNLTRLSLSNNQLSSLPPEFSQLSNLTRLYLDNNPQLSSPPPEIVEQGTQAILTYLRERLEGSLQQWVSKLLVVGEGGVGKTSLLRVLRGEAFDTQESTTHGIEIKWLDLSHPSKAGTNMHLKTWDFGGQEIYHATHQFFLTNRSLFLLAWNARLGFEQGKLYTTGIHWRNGVLFAYEQEHLALVQAVKSDRYIKLTVRGTNPLNFFVLLRDGIELTLARFPGLDIQRTIPCLGHNGQPCTHEFDYKQLSQRWEKNKGTIECPEAMEDVSVPELLYGLNWNTQNAVLERIDQLEKTVVDTVVDGQTLILDEFKNLLELTQREFTNAFRREQAKIDSHCPNVFVLRLHGDKAWKKNLTGQKLNLQLYCQAPGCWHPTQEGGLYEINEPAKWLRATAPYLGRLFRVLKYAAPIIGPWLGVIDPKEYETLFKNDLELFKEVAAKLPELKQSEDLELADKIARGEDLDPERADGAALRALRQLLDEKDPQQHWGGLKNVLTPEGHYLWLCEHHASEYKR
ncbi:leucine-rich repeat domain-containing protein, partial [Nostoc sp.]|uniref:leucine-rich repeat domain-containing protein n=1 Tax=Nostoc sp. TaxID=1180 RepID=UPI002FF663A7